VQQERRARFYVPDRHALSALVGTDQRRIDHAGSRFEAAANGLVFSSSVAGDRSADRLAAPFGFVKSGIAI
jgi:hypothetical protein